ncbi:condensation domain-containing protein [Micromonospora sp. NPDC004551]|uniref:condensation domain-containing protein n=1 Tax=Micromonospora sp. NPDC004551 TaxID=3154284 RepID=UPI00339FEBF2
MDDQPFGQRILSWAGGPADIDRFVALGGIRLPAEPDPADLRQALDAVVARHPVLGQAPVPLRTVDDVWAAAAAGQYPPDARCLLWAYLAGRELLLVAHHTVSDPWSMRLLLREVLKPQTGPAPSYHDSRSTYPTARVNRSLPFWQQTLADVPALNPSTGSETGTAEIRTPSGITQEQSAAVARTMRSTPFVVLLTAFAQALSPLCSGEAVIPVLTHGRQRSDWDTVGLYMNVLPVRLGTPTVQAVHRAFAEAYAHEIPFPVLLNAVPQTGALFTDGGPGLAQFEVIQVPDGAGIEPLTIPAGLGLGGPVLPVNGLTFWLEPGAGGAYTTCLRYRRTYREDEMRALTRRFIDSWEKIRADTNRA